MDRDRERLRLIDQMHLRTAASLGGMKDPERLMLVKLPQEEMPRNGDALEVTAKMHHIFEQLARGQ